MSVRSRTLIGVPSVSVAVRVRCSLDGGSITGEPPGFIVLEVFKAMRTKLGNSARRIVLMCLSMLLVMSCASVPRIDGTSAQAFDRSYEALVDSLTPEERLQLTWAQLVFLVPTGCVGSKKSESFITAATGVPEADIRPCREQLHGMTYKDILDKAYP